MSGWTVSLTTPDGDTMVVHPKEAATHGVYLAEGQVKGDIVDAPVKTEWDSLALQEGGTQRGTDWEYRDIHLGFHVIDDVMSAEEADSLLRMKLDYEEDEWDPNPITQTRLTLETDLSGERNLDILMSEQTTYDFNNDPIEDQYFNPTYVMRAGQPMWYEQSAGQPYKLTSFDFGSGSTTGGLYIENRTDRAARHSWVVAAGVGSVVQLPDVSWVGPKGARVVAGPMASRMLTLPTITSAHGGGFRITLQRGQLMIRDFNNTNVLGQMPVPGTYFMNRIPPYTRKTFLPIIVSGVPSGGGRIECRMPLLWSRPYGLEMW